MNAIGTRRLCAAVLALILMAMTACAPGGSGQEAPEVTGSFGVECLSVGKADAILLTTAEHTVVVDTGNRGDGKTILSRLAEEGRESIDTLIITHFDKDHVGGAVRLLHDIKVGEVLIPDYIGNNEEYERFTEALSEMEITPHIVREKTAFCYDDVAFTLYPARKAEYTEEDNDHSLVLSVLHGENSFLFAGDAEKERIAELLEEIPLAHDFLKVPHHGKAEKNSRAFFQSVNPRYAVITDSAEEPADAEVVSILTELGAEVCSTADGTVCVTSDGETLRLTRRN